MNCRIFYLVGELGLGGLQRQLCFLLEHMDRSRYLPEVLVWDFRETDPYVSRIRALGIPLHSIRGTDIGARKLHAFRRIVLQVKPEVVHSYSFYTNFAASWATLGTKTIAVGSVRSDFSKAKDNAGLWLGRLSARWPRYQIYNSFVAAQNARRSRNPFVPRHLAVVRNGLDLHRFQMTPLSAGGRVCIVGVGSLLPVKRWDRLLKAAAELKQRGLDFLVRIAGKGPLLESLTQQAQDLGLKDRIEFLGYAEDIPRLISEATFMVHTSDTEGCPNAVMEAMACGRALVATDAGEIPLLVRDGQTGFVVTRGDSAMLLERMTTLIRNRDLCRQMGEAGRATAEKEFGLDRLLSQTLDVYRAAGWKDSR